MIMVYIHKIIINRAPGTCTQKRDRLLPGISKALNIFRQASAIYSLRNS